MNKMEVRRQNEEAIHFVLKVNEKHELAIAIRKYKVWKWQLAATNEINEWNYFEFVNGNFSPTDNEAYYSINSLEEIKNGFYDLIKQIKDHPNYRLRLMNMLDEDIREIWEAV